jgi:hypothetical protein
MKIEHRLARLEAERCVKPNVGEVVTLRRLMKPSATEPILVGIRMRGVRSTVQLDRKEGESEADFMVRTYAAQVRATAEVS